MPEPNASQMQLLEQRRIASVATIGPDGAPHLTATWFLYESGNLFLAIASSSAKARNLAGNSNIAVMIDVRARGNEAGLTAVGEAKLITGEEAILIVRRLHEKYLTAEAIADPGVGPVFAAIDDIAVQVIPTRWISWDMGELDRQAFGGAIARNRYLAEIRP